MDSNLPVLCPNCKNEMSNDKKGSVLFCPQCGTKVYKKTEKTYVKQYDSKKEWERLVDYQRGSFEENKISSRHYNIFQWFIFSIILMFIGAFGISSKILLLEIIFIVGLVLMVWSYVYYKESPKDKRFLKSESGIQVTNLISSYKGKNCLLIVSRLQEMGFANIITIPLRNLKYNQVKKKDTVESMTIDGHDEINENDYFSENAQIIIKYNSIV